jgi:hypothetical protein
VRKISRPTRPRARPRPYANDQGNQIKKSNRETAIPDPGPDARRETQEILSDPDAVAQIRESEADLASGGLTDAKDLRDAMIARRHGARPNQRVVATSTSSAEPSATLRR